MDERTRKELAKKFGAELRARAKKRGEIFTGLADLKREQRRPIPDPENLKRLIENIKPFSKIPRRKEIETDRARIHRALAQALARLTGVRQPQTPPQERSEKIRLPEPSLKNIKIKTIIQKYDFIKKIPKKKPLPPRRLRG
ncbi:MAG: hypothetical protein Q7K42_03180 [Candidatus Diapherotrites archaeon]|nr:hypothetical protein [Candidatus Diapherotrites archaeon]